MYSKEYYQHNKEHRAAIMQRYYQAHKVEYAKRARKYRKTIKGYLCQCFQGIKQRCNNPNCKSYKYYGGRKIKCLFKNVDSFISYVIDILKVDPRGLQIDRIDNDGHYEPGNIRFVTNAENCNNKGKYRKRK